jgi:RNA polymerase sigma-70 factor (ECF subfamily)
LTDGADEQALADGCRAGRLAAFEELYQAYGRRMRSVAVNLLGNVHDAEDAVQEAFLRAYRNIGSFRGESALGSWMHRILVNACHDIGRQKKRRGGETDLEAAGSPAVEGRDHPLHLALEESLARLKPRERSVFVLFEVEGFKHREIGEILEISEVNSKTLLFTAKKKLQKLLAGAGWRQEVASA